MKYGSYINAKNLPRRREVAQFLFSVSETSEFKRRHELEKKYNVNSDTETRKGIHELIEKGLKTGKNDDEILTELESKYNNSGLSKFFKGYIEDHKRKMINARDDEGR